MSNMVRYGTAGIEVTECESVEEFLRMTKDYELDDDNIMFITFDNGKFWASPDHVRMTARRDIRKAVFENDFEIIHYNATVIETTDDTGYRYVEVA